MFQYLNQNAGAIQAVVALLLVVPTCISLWIAWRAHRETRAAADRATRPTVLVAIEVNSVSHLYGDLVIRNAGPGAVRDLRLTISPEGVTDLDGDFVKDHAVFKSPFPVLFQGQEYRTLVFSFSALLDKEKGVSQIQFAIDYRDETGRQHVDKFSYKMDLFAGQQRLQEQGLHDIGRHTDQISKNLEKLTRQVQSLESEMTMARLGAQLEHSAPGLPDGILAYVREMALTIKAEPKLMRLLPWSDHYRVRFLAIADALLWYGGPRVEAIRSQLIQIATARGFDAILNEDKMPAMVSKLVSLVDGLNGTTPVEETDGTGNEE